jgi:hypothetical protein
MDDGTARPETDDEPEGMPEPEDDFRSLAEDWIAIWQSEITAYLTDPETQQAWGAMIAIWAGAAQAMVRSMPPAAGFGSGFGSAQGPHATKRPRAPAGGDERRRTAAAAVQPGADAAPGAAPAAAAPVARDDEVRRLEQRVAELERSLAEQDRRRGIAGGHRRTRRTVRPRS